MPPDDKPRSKLGDTIFALFHVFALATLLVFAVIDLIQGNTTRFGVIAGGLILYYILVLHKPVLKEIERRRNLKSEPPSKKS
ncbi:MAG: hypothetical protein Q8O91_02790 [Candidatus Aminicenantes bacterium]|nr:hypothetical protein [Candidatus Aminicenantes bacterium]